jgi:polar amino acid transport system substrate-binding protein
MKRLMALGAALGLLLLPPLLAAESPAISISTAPWQPYINAVDAPTGSAAQLLEQIYSQRNIRVNWRHQNYDLAFRQTAQGETQLSFPYFKTPQRVEQVLFSDPVLKVRSHIYYNRHYRREVISPQQLRSFKVGRVAGYSYGTEIDQLVEQAEIYSDEGLALTALLAGDIDYLPMTQSVMNHLLNSNFSAQKLLVRALPGIEGEASMHLIAARTAAGEARIAELNALLATSAGLKSLELSPLQLQQSPDIARLVATEGYPLILGQDTPKDDPNYYTLPQGSRVLVLQWSEKITVASKSDRLYKTMMDLSKVVVLNGPHSGRELYIRNMHIELL